MGFFKLPNFGCWFSLLFLGVKKLRTLWLWVQKNNKKQSLFQKQVSKFPLFKVAHPAFMDLWCWKIGGFYRIDRVFFRISDRWKTQKSQRNSCTPTTPHSWDQKFLFQTIFFRIQRLVFGNVHMIQENPPRRFDTLLGWMGYQQKGENCRGWKDQKGSSIHLYTCGIILRTHHISMNICRYVQTYVNYVNVWIRIYIDIHVIIWRNFVFFHAVKVYCRKIFSVFLRWATKKDPGDLLYIKEMILPSYVGMPTWVITVGCLVCWVI